MVRGDLGAIWRASSVELAFWIAYFSKTRISLTPWIVSVLRDYFCKTVLDQYRQKVKRPGVGQAKVDLQSAPPTVRRQKDNSSWNGHSDGKSSRWNLREVCVFEDNDNDHRRRRKLTQSSETVSHSSALPTRPAHRGAVESKLFVCSSSLCS